MNRYMGIAYYRPGLDEIFNATNVKQSMASMSSLALALSVNRNDRKLHRIRHNRLAVAFSIA